MRREHDQAWSVRPRGEGANEPARVELATPGLSRDEVERVQPDGEGQPVFAP